MVQPPKRRLVPTFKEPAFDQYALAIGRLSLAWNDLNERLASLFGALMGGELAKRPIAVWNSANFDRARREMIKAAAFAASPNELSEFPNMVDEIKWLCDRVNDFENLRNDAIHSPLLLHITSKGLSSDGIAFFAEKVMDERVAPNDLRDNTRASRLIGKDLLLEFAWCYESVIVLRDYAVSINNGLKRAPWPNRPPLPARPPQNQRPGGKSLACHTK